MDSHEAIKYTDAKAFELLCTLETCNSEQRKKRLNEEYKFICFARSCIEKEVPQKPVNISQEYDGTYGDCVNCGRKLTDFENFTRCPDCGQAIDWSSVL